LRTQALLGAGALAAWQGDVDVAESLLDECQSLARSQHDHRSVAWSAAWLGVARAGAGQVAHAIPLFEESLTQFRALQDLPGTAFALLNLGVDIAIQGDAARTVPLFEDCLALFRTLGDTRYVAIAQSMLGSSLTALGDVTRAAGLVAEGMAGHWEVGDRTSLVYGLVVMAAVLSRLNQPVRAVRLLGAAEALHEALGGFRAFATLTRHERLVAALRRRLPDAEFAPAWAAGRTMTFESAVAEALIDAPAASPSSRPRQADRRRELPDPLTPREREVARLVAHGYTDRQIAETLTIGLSTVGTHVHHVLAKLGVHSRWQVAERFDTHND
jgi:non-specific serine/threonine protein kinase